MIFSTFAFTLGLAHLCETRQRRGQRWVVLSSIILLAACGQTEPQNSNKSPVANTLGGGAPNASDPARLSATADRYTAAYGADELNPEKQVETDLCADLTTHADRVRIPRVAHPPFMKYYKDPVFGSRIIRISDSGPGQVTKNVYSTMQAWNSDESLLLLYRTGGEGVVRGHYLHDGMTYEPIRKLDIAPSDLEEIFWSHNDPSSFFYVSRNGDKKSHLLKSNALTGEEVSLFDFSDFCGSASTPEAGENVQMQSYDDDVFGFRCGTETNMKAFSLRLSDKTVSGIKIGENTDYSSWFAPAPSPSGERMLLANRVFGTELGRVRQSLDFKGQEHASIGKTYDNKDALFSTAFDPAPNGCEGDTWGGVGHLIEYNLQTGSCRSIVNQSGRYPYTTRGTHISATARLKPGWVAMSSIGYGSFEYLDKDLPAPTLLSEVYLVDTNPENTRLCRLAHHRSTGKEATHGGYQPYFGEPHASLSPSGTRIIFASDWYDSGSVDSYVIELPAFRR